MKNRKKNSNVSRKAKFKPGSKKRENKCVVMFDDKEREDYLTGFHKRKVERRKAAIAEIRKKIKDEQNRVREERHKEYMKMLKERKEALEESEDDLEDVITSTTESVQVDHPNHTVTVTTISDLDLTSNHLLERVTNKVSRENKEDEETTTTTTMPKKSGNPIMNKKIRSLTASLSAYTSKGKRKGKQEGGGGRGRQTDKRAAVGESKISARKTSKLHRRRMTGKKRHQED
ncbi:nucleolar protein 12 [Dunckerocampus dactyliophorus]|uniref:nucleolar protein 12 n=1 Tax=Dunckerocampus dactyliophorus TaxID=161453 RepID=UPI002406BB32|nr:nucleolar protein 12 [Dunckerocampus dactyliophorus]